MRRHLVLPERGVLLISTDVHGNAGDFERLEAIFEDERSREPETHWVILGDVVHAPDASARKRITATPAGRTHTSFTLDLAARYEGAHRCGSTSRSSACIRFSPRSGS